jgi:hypothetical protein
MEEMVGDGLQEEGWKRTAEFMGILEGLGY